jgi:hypothetical protein
MANGSFSEELKVFQQHRDEWLRSNVGKFVVIQDSTIAEGFFETYADALRAGLRTFGVSRNFLVKQVWETEPIYFVS